MIPKHVMYQAFSRCFSVLSMQHFNPAPETTEDTPSTEQSSELPLACYRNNLPKANNSHISASDHDYLDIHTSPIAFSFDESLTEREVQISFADYYNEVHLLYYPGNLDTSDLNSENVINSIKCLVVNVAKVVISDLQPSTVYTFCAMFPNEEIQSPFQCKSHQTKLSRDQQPWIAQDKKVVALVSFFLVTVIVFFIGAFLTYLMIRRMPKLIRGSKRVVRVHSQPQEESPDSSRASSIRKETNTLAIRDAPIYLTPRPRQSVDLR